MLTSCKPDNSNVSNYSESEKKLTYYFSTPGTAIQLSGSYNNTLFAKHLNEKTGIEIDYINHIGNPFEHLKLLMSIDELPDILEVNWNQYVGGPEKAIDDGLIIELTEVINQYAPNLKAYLNKNSQVDKNIRSDSVKYYSFPFIREDEILHTYQGPIVRKDWLDKCGLSLPVTIDDWTFMLREFKEKMGAVAPLTLDRNSNAANITFAGAFGVINGFYLEDDTIKYGPYEDEFYNYIKLFRDWYAEGLLDSFYINSFATNIEINIISGKSGATVFSAGIGLGKWIDMVNDDSGFNLEGTLYPVISHGQTPKFSQYDTTVSAAAISTSCKDVELAATFLDYGYSEEGKLVYNFGIEGESYIMVNGKPRYTDLIINNPSYPITTIMANYIRGNLWGPFIQMKDYIMQYYTLPQQRSAVERWNKTDMKNHILPQIIFVDSEAKEITKIAVEIEKYSTEWFNKFVLGIEPLENFSMFQKGLADRDIDRLLQIYQKAYHRYSQK